MFSAAHQTYKNYMESVLADSNASDIMRKGAADSRDGEDTPEAEAFEKVVKDKIADGLRDQYSDLIAQNDLEVLIRESQAAF